MKVPNHEKARIAPEKIRDYLLSDTHPIGRYKAEIFRSLGYEASKWDTLLKDIRQLLDVDAEEVGKTEYGRKFAVRGSIHGPNGRKADIVTVWMLRDGEDFVRFVTAYPED